MNTENKIVRSTGLLTYLWIVLTLILSVNCSSDNKIAELKISFGSSGNAIPGHKYSVVIMIDTFLEDLESFRLRISYNNDAFNVKNVRPGGLFENLHWIDSNMVSSIPDTGGINAHIEISADKKSHLNDSLRLIISSSHSIVLASIDFAVTEDSAFGCTRQFFRFFWTECQDNAIILSDGDELYISKNVLDADYTEITPRNSFPDFSIDNNHCIEELKLTGDVTANPIIKFVNQTTWISCAEEIDQSGGDIILN